jgi:transposase
MMQAYSLDLRERVVSAYENGVETILEVAERFEVSDSFINKLLRRKRTTGTIAPVGHRGGQPKRLSEKHRKWLLKTVLAQPDITLGDLRERLLNEHQILVSVPTLSRELRASNLRRKKNRWSLVNAIGANGRGIGDECGTCGTNASDF